MKIDRIAIPLITGLIIGLVLGTVMITVTDPIDNETICKHYFSNEWDTVNVDEEGLDCRAPNGTVVEDVVVHYTSPDYGLNLPHLAALLASSFGAVVLINTFAWIRGDVDE